MKLYFNALSPFARKVLVVAHERGLVDQIEPISVMLTPLSPSDDVNAVNPVGKIPALVLDDGASLYDSPLVCEYLDALAGALLFPAGAARWTALRHQAAADGLMDAAILVRYERGFRPAEKQFEDWVAAQMLKIRRTLDSLEHEAASLSGVTIGEVSVACALGYLDFRFPDEKWRDGRPGLAEFYEKFGARPSMAATRPPS